MTGYGPSLAIKYAVDYAETKAWQSDQMIETKDLPPFVGVL